jgi:hypothetical protein
LNRVRLSTSSARAIVEVLNKTTQANVKMIQRRNSCKVLCISNLIASLYHDQLFKANQEHFPTQIHRSQNKKEPLPNREVPNKNNTLYLSLNKSSIIMTSTTKKPPLATDQSEASIMWDQAEKGYLTDAERIAKNMDIDGKGHLSREQSVSLGAQFQGLKEDNKQIKKQLYGLAVLCVILFIGTVVGTVMAVKNSKDTIVDMKTGVMKVKDGNGGVDVVTVQAQGTTFQTTGSVMMNEETTTDGETFTKIFGGHCVSSEDIASMWLANEKGTDARLVITDDTDTVSSIEPVTTGRASWNEDHIVMGGMTFIPNEECSNSNRRKLLESTDIEDNDMPSFDSISIHRALKQRVDFLSGRRLQNGGATPTSYAVADVNRSPTENPSPVLLGTAGNFAILSQSGITNVPTSVITGDMGVSPIARTAVTGFDWALDSTNTFSTSAQVTGKIYASNDASPIPSQLTTAVGDMEIAYTNSQLRTSSGGFYNNIGGGEIGSLIMTKGVYIFGTSVSITNSIKFSGNANDIFIIITSNDLEQAADTKVILEAIAVADGGDGTVPKAENIFWSVKGKVVVKAGAHMKGILLVKTSAAFLEGSKLDGRALTQTAVTLDQSVITAP